MAKQTKQPGSRATTPLPPNTSASMNTRKSRTQPTGPLTREEALNRALGDVKTPDKAMGYLADRGYVPEGTELSLQIISFILLQIAAALNAATDANGIKAVALLLEEIEVYGIAETLSDRITKQIGDKIDTVRQCILDVRRQEAKDFKGIVEGQRQELEGIRKEVQDAAMSLKEGAEELEGTQNNLENAVGEIAEFFQTSIMDIAEKIDVITSLEPQAIATPSQQAAPPLVSYASPTDVFSYAAITRTHLPNTHATNITRNNDRRRQFTILPASNEDDMGLDALTELDIIAKLNLAYETMKVGKDLAPPTIRFAGVRRMRKGGIVFEVNSDAAADWLQNEEHQTDFTNHFSAKTRVHGYQFRVLAEFVPISFDAGASNATRNIEEANDLPAGSIAEIGWVKKIEKRTATQQVAHLKISFTTIEQANKAIGKGLTIQGKGVNVRQMIVEPQ